MFDFLDWLPFYGNFISGFSFGGKKKSPQIQEYKPPPYSGPRPYTGEQVGFGADQLKTLAGAYLPELQRRARGEGLVGFDPRYRETLRGEFLKDFGDYESDIYAKASQQASGQGLRGGIPMSIQAENTKNLGRAREAGLADIDLRDLEARREDINTAFYQQPQEIQRGTNIQKGAADFGLQEYNATKPEPYFPPETDYSPFGDALNLGLSTIGMGGGTGRIPIGGGQGQLGQAFYGQGGGVSGNTGYNKSFYKDPNFYMDAAKLAAMFFGGCWVAAELFGWEDSRTHESRYFINELAQKWFKNLYLKHGEKFAEFIHDKPILKGMLRPVFEMFAFLGRLNLQGVSYEHTRF